MIKFVLMVNKQGQTRLASYFQWYPIQERVALEAEVTNESLWKFHIALAHIHVSHASFRLFEDVYLVRNSSAPLLSIVDSKLFIDVTLHCSLSWR